MLNNRIFILFSIKNISYIDLQQLLPLGCEVEGDAVHVAGEGGSTHQENYEDGVGEKSSEIDKLKIRTGNHISFF